MSNLWEIQGVHQMVAWVAGIRQVHREGVTHGKGRLPPGKEAHLVC